MLEGEEDLKAGNDGLSEETRALAEAGRRARSGEPQDPPAGDPAAPSEEVSEVPDWVPEKFRKDGAPDYEALAKAYAELERKQATEPKPKEDPKEAPKDGEEPKGEDEPKADPAVAFQEQVQASIQGAMTEYAEKGELAPKTYESLSTMLGKEYVDNYLAGVAALENAMMTEVYDLSGGEDSYKAAVEWARENWSPSKIEKYDAAMGDEDLRPTLVRDLMASFTTANPGEGQFTERQHGSVDTGDLYHNMDEFHAELAAADNADDKIARRKAVQKLERSKRAKTVGGTRKFGLKSQQF